MTIELPGLGPMALEALLEAAGGYWIYRCPRFFANWLWIPRHFPSYVDAERNPPDKFVRFFQIIGLVGMWSSAASMVIWFILGVSGMGVVGYEPPAI